MGLTAAVGKHAGVTSAAFAIALIFSFVVMYDAAGLRRAAGRQAAILNRLVEDLRILSLADAGELPAFFRLKEIAVGGAEVIGRGGTGATPEHKLIAHELAVVFAQRSFRSGEAGIRGVLGTGPLPDITPDLLERRGFSHDDFAALHPGGRLGKKLSRVENLMHSGDAMPRVPITAKIPDVIYEISKKGLGMTTVVDGEGRLAGILTDGDLRRHMGPDLMSALVDDVMTKAPKTVVRDTLASEALEILNSSKVTALMVADAGKPVGIVHFHDFLRAGVA